MLFQKRFWEGIRDGSITLTFRRWKRLQVLVGNRYRTPIGLIEVEAVDIVDPASITDDEAQRSGHGSAEALHADMPGTPNEPTYRIAFRYVDEPDPRTELANDASLGEDDVAEIDRRLDRIDARSPVGPWTMATLRTIAEHPHRRAGDLAEMHGRERLDFKKDVRKLKNLGLTLSFDPGYRLSPRGEAYLRMTRRT
ncbi:MAG TPA: hypothetical protein VGC47_05645 [Acidimicrobiia bacterium]